MPAVAFFLAICANFSQLQASESGWRALPLITAGHVDQNWCHGGWGEFSVDGDSLRTECDPKGLGLLAYRKERFGNCQLRVVFKSKEANGKQ